MKMVKRRPVYPLTMLALFSMLAPAVAGEFTSLQPKKGEASQWQCIADLHGDWKCLTQASDRYTTLENINKPYSPPIRPITTQQASNWQCFAEPGSEWKCRNGTETGYKYSLESVNSEKKYAISARKSIPDKKVMPDRKAMAAIKIAKPALAAPVLILESEKEILEPTPAISKLEVLQQEIEVLSEALELLNSTDDNGAIESIHLSTSTVASAPLEEQESTVTESDMGNMRIIDDGLALLPVDQQLQHIENSLTDNISFINNKLNVNQEDARQEIVNKPKENTSSFNTFERLLVETLSTDKAEDADISAALSKHNKSNKQTGLLQKSFAPPETRQKKRPVRQHIARLLMAEQMNSEPPFDQSTITSIKRTPMEHASIERQAEVQQPILTQDSYEAFEDYDIAVQPARQYKAPPPVYRMPVHHSSGTTQMLMDSSRYQAQPENIRMPEKNFAPSTIHRKQIQQPHAGYSSSPARPVTVSSKHYAYRQHFAPMIEVSRGQKRSIPYHHTPAISTKDMLAQMQRSVDDGFPDESMYYYNRQKTIEPRDININNNIPVSSAERLQRKAKEFDKAQQEMNRRQQGVSPLSKADLPADITSTYPHYAASAYLRGASALQPVQESSFIFNSPDNYFTMQWGASTRKADLQKLQQRYLQLAAASIIPSTINGQLHYLLVYGAYKNMHTALSSLRQPQWRHLANTLNPWARTIESLKMPETTVSSTAYNTPQTLPQGGYTIQWAKSVNLTDLQKLKQTYPQFARATILRLHRAQQTHYVLTEGNYPDRLTALDVLSRPELASLAQLLHPKARPMASLRDADSITPKPIPNSYPMSNNTVIPETTSHSSSRADYIQAPRNYPYHLQ